MENQTEIIYEVVKVEDHNEILDFMRKFYYPYEPITIGNEPLQQTVEDEESAMSNLKYNCSWKATVDGKIVGALIVGPLCPGDADKMIEEAKTTESKKWAEILLLLAFLDKKANIFKRFNVSKTLHLQMLAVDPQFSGKSIGYTLMAKSLEHGSTIGYELASAYCSSVISTKIAVRLEMENIEELPFDEYKDENGRIVFKPPQPHNKVTTFVKRL